MRLLYIIFSALITLSCTNSPQSENSKDLATENNKGNSPTARQSSDSSKWTNSFLEFSKAITKGDRNAVKSFIDFPIKNEGNEIWYLADSRLVMEISPKKIVPFTESDFDKYFSSIFALPFRKTLEKLNVDEFFEKNTAISPEIEVVKGSRSKLQADYYKANNKVTLTLFTTGEANLTVQYRFDITTDEQLRFRQVHVE